MLDQDTILNVLKCPSCGEGLNEELRCTGCGKKFSTREGVYILIDRKLSKIEWRWDRRILSKKYRAEIMEGYIKLLSEKVREAQQEWWDASVPKINAVSGVVVDIATGLGIMLEKLLKGSIDFAIATDIDPNVLLSTKREFDQKLDKKAFYLATDVKHMALADEIADYVTSFAGTDNISDTEQVIREMYRILKPGGKVILMSSFADEQTPTADLAEEYGFLEAFIKEKFLEILRNIGFKNIEIVDASSTVWEENKMDIFPIPGDTIYYSVIEAEK